MKFRSTKMILAAIVIVIAVGAGVAYAKGGFSLNSPASFPVDI